MKLRARSTLKSIVWIVFSLINLLLINTAFFGAVPAYGDGPIGSWGNFLEGPLPEVSLICCQDTLQCTDGDDTYQNCRMPDETETNMKLCNFSPGTEEYPYICDTCPGGVGEHCNGSGWTEVADGEFQCDGPVYRSEPPSVRNIAPDVWYIAMETTECNNSYSQCRDATCYEPDCMPCSNVLNPWADGACPNEPGALCHQGNLQGGGSSGQ